MAIHFSEDCYEGSHLLFYIFIWSEWLSILVRTATICRSFIINKIKSEWLSILVRTATYSYHVKNFYKKVRVAIHFSEDCYFLQVIDIYKLMLSEWLSILVRTATLEPLYRDNTSCQSGYPF